MEIGQRLDWLGAGHNRGESSSFCIEWWGELEGSFNSMPFEPRNFASVGKQVEIKNTEEGTEVLGEIKT